MSAIMDSIDALERPIIASVIVPNRGRAARRAWAQAMSGSAPFMTRGPKSEPPLGQRGETGAVRHQANAAVTITSTL